MGAKHHFAGTTAAALKMGSMPDTRRSVKRRKLGEMNEALHRCRDRRLGFRRWLDGLARGFE